MKEAPDLHVIHNGLVWKLWKRTLADPKRIGGRNVLCYRRETLLVTEDFREIKALLAQMGVGLFDPGIRYRVSPESTFGDTSPTPDRAYRGETDCLIPRPGTLANVPGNMPMGLFMALDYGSRLSGGFYCEPRQLFQAGFRFTKFWP